MRGYHFTEDVRQVLASSREHAFRLRHEYVGTEHILLALVDAEGSVALDVLRSSSIAPDDVRSRIHAVVKQGTSSRSADRDLPYTSRAKKVLELAMNEARELGHDYVGTEHLLLGLMREGKGIAGQVLHDVGASAESIRAEVLKHPEVPQAAFRSVIVTGPQPPFRRTYGILAGGVVLLGLVHTAATFGRHSTLTQAALFFASAGLLMILCGALNYLNIAYGATARGLQRTTVAANVILTVFATLAGIAGGASVIELVVVVGLFAGTTLLSVAFAYVASR